MSRAPRTTRSGTVLIVAMLVTFSLAGMTLVLCRTMRVEMIAAANGAAALQASAVQRGAEQYVLGVLATEADNVRNLSEDQFAAIRVGDGYFWVLRPQYAEDDGSTPVFGLVEESAKLNLNTASYDQIMRLPGMTEEIGSAIMEWKDADENVERMGPESEYYLSLPEPYYSKNANFETVEELLLVRGIDRTILYGDGTAPPLGEPAGMRTTMDMRSGLMTDPELARGWYALLTVRSAEPNMNAQGERRIDITQLNRSSRRSALRDRLRARFTRERADQIMSALGDNPRVNTLFAFARRAKLEPAEFDLIADDLTTSGNDRIRGLININTAPRAVLACLDGLSSVDVDTLIAKRGSGGGTGLAWVMEALGARADALTNITTRSHQYTADILAVSGNGRAFKRCRVVIDTSDTSAGPQIVYRRDLTDRGWPMDRQILASIRAGQYQSSFSTGAIASAAGGGR